MAAKFKIMIDGSFEVEATKRSRAEIAWSLQNEVTRLVNDHFKFKKCPERIQETKTESVIAARMF